MHLFADVGLEHVEYSVWNPKVNLCVFIFCQMLNQNTVFSSGQGNLRSENNWYGL